MSLVAETRAREAPPVDEAYEPVLRWLIFTGVSIFAAVLLWRYGLIRLMVASDRTYISSVIAALYVAASLHCLWRTVAISREAAAANEISDALARRQADLRTPGAASAWAAGLRRRLISDHLSDLVAKATARGDARLDQTLLLRALADRLRRSNNLGALASDSLIKLGLLGTIIGFILMLGPIAGLDASDEAQVRASMATMSDGMAVAMYTTLAGLVGSIMLKAQYFALEAATVKTFWDMVRLTETRVVPALERTHVR